MRSFILSFCISSCTFEAAAQTTFSPRQVLFADTLSWKEIRTGDMDDDGDDDVVATFGEEGKVIVFANDGFGGFSADPQVITGMNYPVDLVLADLDQDQSTDIAVADFYGNAVWWIRNDGAGLFNAPQLISSSVTYARTICAADVDGDGVKDLISNCQGTGGLLLHRNAGNGSFSEQESIGTTDGAAVVMPADVDGDGDIDLLTSGGQLRWFRNDGSGNFTFGEMLPPTPYYGFGVSDLDNDGDPDVAASGGGDLYWLLNDGQGTFSFFDPLSQLGIGRLLALADIDQDGDEDILGVQPPFMPEDEDYLYWFENTGLGLCCYEQHFINSEVDIVYHRYALGMIDDDGLPDLVHAGGQGDMIEWFKQDLSSSFYPPTPSGTVHYDKLFMPDLICTGNVDNDGADDVLFRCSRQRIQHVDIGADGQPEFYYTDIDSLCNANTHPPDRALCDIDQDGLEDMIFINYSPSTGETGLFRALGTAGGGFGASSAIHYASAMRDMKLTDVDGDGDPDITFIAVDTLSQQNAYVVRVLSNQGNGTFTTPMPAYQAPGWQYFVDAPVLGDVDGDLDQDIIFYLDNALDGLWPSHMMLLENSGNGVFEAADTLRTEDYYDAQRRYLSDLNGDGRAELVKFDWDPPYGLYWYNYMSGLFDTVGTAIDTGYHDEALHFADADGDGDIDILTTGGSVVIRWNDGSGEFGAPDTIDDAFQGDEGAFVDLNGDGYLDIVVFDTWFGFVNGSSTQSVWYANNGPSTIVQVASVVSTHLAVHPNPFQHQAQLSSTTPLEPGLSYAIIDARGVVVRSILIKSSLDLSIERGSLPSGLYMLQLTKDGRLVGSTRFVVD